MIQLPAQSASIPIAPLWPALIAMTGVQALVALALFAPGVLAPQLAMSVADVGLFTTAVFAVGMATSLYGGKFARQFAPCKVAAFCALAVALGMALATRGDGATLVIAGLCIGLAFGPETPASSTLLSKLATPAQRPLIFSIRQTGNQIGAMLGSLTLPLIALSAPIAGYWLIAGLGILAAIVFRLMSPPLRRSGQGRRKIARSAWGGYDRLAKPAVASARFPLLAVFADAIGIERVFGHVCSRTVGVIPYQRGCFARDGPSRGTDRTPVLGLGCNQITIIAHGSCRPRVQHERCGARHGVRRSPDAARRARHHGILVRIDRQWLERRIPCRDRKIGAAGSSGRSYRRGPHRELCRAADGASHHHNRGDRWHLVVELCHLGSTCLCWNTATAQSRS